MKSTSQAISLAATGPAGGVISPLWFGHNLEHTRRCIWQGFSAQILANRKLLGEWTHEGVPVRWYAIGLDRSIFRIEPTPQSYLRHFEAEKPAWHDACSTQWQKIESARPGGRCGMGQGDLHIVGGKGYELRVALQSPRPTKVHLSLRNDSGRREHWGADVMVEPGGWREFRHVFAAPSTDRHARFEITFDAPGTLYVGCTALQWADTFHGLRPDVVELLKRIGVPLLRWPGGNFAGEYHWKDGLLPVDRRAGLKSVGDFTLRFTENYDNHEIGTDEFIALCRELGAEPFITINVTSEGPAEAAQWVRYCNEPADGEWGRLRAQRGHAEPYNVKLWSLGNEAGYGHMKGPTECLEYCTFARECSAAMRAADPTINLTASGTWFEGWIDRVPPWSYEDYENVSYHWYMKHEAQACLGDEGRAAAERAAAAPHRQWQLMRGIREYLDAHLPPGYTMAISYDEWNLWGPWSRPPTTVDGVYAGGFLNRLCRYGGELGITMAAFFQPVNEGAIRVLPDEAVLTPMGQAFELFRVHHGRRLVKVEGGADAGPPAATVDVSSQIPASQRPEAVPSPKIDATASIGDDGGIAVTLANGSASESCRVTLDLSAVSGTAAAAVMSDASSRRANGEAEVTILSPNDAEQPSLSFRERHKKVSIRAGKLRLTVGPLSIVLVRCGP